MNNKLYPPQIEGTIPAFYGTTLVVPFIMNKTVGINEISGTAIKVKSVYNNSVVYDKQVNKDKINFDNYTVEFNIEKNKNPFKKGVFYKVQIAYINKKGKIGYFSTVGIVKYTSEPEVNISNLKITELNSDIHTYIGNYSQSGKDVTEKVYSYNFTIYDQYDNVYETSGELLHNHENDNVVYETSDSYSFKKSLEENKVYKIIYTVTTANGLIKSSPAYRISLQSSIPVDIDTKIQATMEQENGYAKIQLVGGKNTNGLEITGLGTFLLSRSSAETGYTDWVELDRFALKNEKPSNYIYKDFTIEHGHTYKYSLQQYNSTGIYSSRTISNEITANFEHSFLYDGKRQLKIKYNPKVTSFKETLLETKTNTMGGKYPFFFRNGNVCYKEFPISGLISYQSDEEELFLTNEDLLLEDVSFYTRKKQDLIVRNEIANKKDRTTNLTDYNIMAERIFKMKVLEFLNDGNPKLFRSPGEGNCIVRLMNSSLSPDDKLNRMLHTFSTTATEIDEFNTQKLNKYNFISTSEPELKRLMWKTVNIRELINKEKKGNEDWLSIGKENKILSIECVDMTVGDKIQIEYNDVETSIIQIGVTGAYMTHFTKPPARILISAYSNQGQITISYYDVPLAKFETYKHINADGIPVRQLRGYTVDQDIKEFFELEDIKYKVTNYYALNFSINHEDLTIEKKRVIAIIDAALQNGKITQYMYDAKLKKINEAYEQPQTYKFYIDDQEFDINEISEYQLDDLDHVPTIKLGVGICLDVSLQRREIVYDIEETDETIKQKKQDYQSLSNKLLNLLHKYPGETYLIPVSKENDTKFKDEKYNPEYIGQIRSDVKKTYNELINMIDIKLKEREEVQKK